MSRLPTGNFSVCAKYILKTTKENEVCSLPEAHQQICPTPKGVDYFGADRIARKSLALQMVHYRRGAGMYCTEILRKRFNPLKVYESKD